MKSRENSTEVFEIMSLWMEEKDPHFYVHSREWTAMTMIKCQCPKIGFNMGHIIPQGYVRIWKNDPSQIPTRDMKPAHYWISLADPESFEKIYNGIVEWHEAVKNV